jgi:hypothetical protein
VYEGMKNRSNTGPILLAFDSLFIALSSRGKAIGVSILAPQPVPNATKTPESSWMSRCSMGCPGNKDPKRFYREWDDAGTMAASRRSGVTRQGCGREWLRCLGVYECGEPPRPTLLDIKALKFQLSLARAAGKSVKYNGPWDRGADFSNLINSLTAQCYRNRGL